MKKLLFVLIASFLAIGFAQDLGGRVLLIGSDTTYPPFETVSEDGEIVGFDIDLMNAVCERVNCVAQFQTTAWDGIFAALAAGEFDAVVSGVSITPERDEIVDFSNPYLVVNQAITVRVEDEDLTFEDFKDDGDLILGAQIGTTNANLAEAEFGRDRVQLYDTFPAAILALINGDISGVVIDGTAADAFEQQYAGQVSVNIRGLSADPLGMVVQEGDELVDALNAGLTMIQEDGTLDALISKWFNEE
ncbi:MAG: transporter substrate-binding domain-containing protein [Trueperaceae bacterium]|nr:MAG: transporter substrate-binding domain-containing protein [Trueperaceae bacterium]